MTAAVAATRTAAAAQERLSPGLLATARSLLISSMSFRATSSFASIAENFESELLILSVIVAVSALMSPCNSRRFSRISLYSPRSTLAVWHSNVL